MEPIDYRTSYAFGEADFNQVRFVIESRTEIVDLDSDVSSTFYQAAPCISEHTFGDEYLFQENSYEFFPVLGPENYVIFRHRKSYMPNFRDVLPHREMWGQPSYDITYLDSVRELKTIKEIINATKDSAALIGQSVYEDTETNTRVTTEYPIKTMNTLTSDSLFQVDTGPVVVPDTYNSGDTLPNKLNLGFIAFNDFEKCEIIVDRPVQPWSRDYNSQLMGWLTDTVVSPITNIFPDRVTSSHHYSARRRFDATNRIYSSTNL